ncbi:hypothetical protein ASF11_22520 [Acidovorax sp. Leaf76]|uniref:DUF4124 domain-containing protein n=1 Tax=unclassified Acidovorax TaxID=2684926 RepID=UPI0007006C3E|nr:MULTISPECIES: DUF4124 domain-containing protein [unclassified Acidovorax]KQO24019.1 hypothetical protein ASF11_22520 [Acidovorax sp. Leaf76]KQO38471.1 hypothetical protein ASF19_19675 [Acidovorax sp. Leaf84]KQS40830.1 hypothetical protein ASG27_21080 [Acidovorax sp. Leaf191]
MMKNLQWLAMAAVVSGLFGGAHAQPVYKWVDAEGKTHYGAQPPPSKADAEPLKLQSNNGATKSVSSSSASGKPGQQYNADGTKKVPKDVEEFGEDMKKALQKVDGKQVPLNCSAAVGNIHDQADTMLEVGQKNVRDGYMSKAEFDKTAPKIREARGKYSVSDCQSSSGNKKLFYQCMSSSYNHVMGCDKQYKHGE